MLDKVGILVEIKVPGDKMHVIDVIRAPGSLEMGGHNKLL